MRYNCLARAQLLPSGDSYAPNPFSFLVVRTRLNADAVGTATRLGKTKKLANELCDFPVNRSTWEFPGRRGDYNRRAALLCYLLLKDE